MDRREAITRTVKVSSAAALIGLIPHYLLHYLRGTPLWTDQIAEWIMARTPSQYAVSILTHLGAWSKPWANTGGLALLGFTLFAARLCGGAAAKRWRETVSLTAGLGLALLLAWNTGYASWPGSISFWAPALAIAALVSRKAPERPLFADRRKFMEGAAGLGMPLLMSGGVVAVAAESFVRNRVLASRAKQPVDLFPFQPPLDRQSFGSGLVRKAVTSVPEFYGMSKNTIDPVIDPAAWRLSVSVDGKTLRVFRYADLIALPKQVRYVTLRCISNTLKSDLMGTAQWAGVCLSQLIERSALPANITRVAFIGVEGHDDSLKIDYAFSGDTMLALGMNGKTLSRTHGFPIRLLAPSYYGCRSVKWIHEIRFVTKPYYGTWQRLGYTNEPLIHICSHIDHMRRDGSLLQFGGVSFAGTRGIKGVRVRVGAGPWEPARLEPSLSTYTWTRWVSQLHAKPGAVIEANAQDGAGKWQELAEGKPFPTGPSGPTIVIARA